MALLFLITKYLLLFINSSKSVGAFLINMLHKYNQALVFTSQVVEIPNSTPIMVSPNGNTCLDLSLLG